MDRVFLFKAAVSAAIILIVVQFIDLQKTLQIILGSRLEFLLLSAILFAAQIAISAYKVWILVKFKEKKIGFRRMLYYYCVGWAAGLVSVGKIGEFSASYFLKKDGMPYSRSLAIILVDKITTLLAFTAIAIAGTFLFFGLSNVPLAAFSAILLAGLAAFAVILVKVNPSELPFVKAIPKLNDFASKHSNNFNIFRETFIDFFSSGKKLLAENMALTIVRVGIMALNSIFLFMAINSNIDFFFMVFIIAVTAIIALMPITISGLGIVEISFIYLASLVGIGAETALATQALTLAINYFAGVLIAFIWVGKIDRQEIKPDFYKS
ncbi:MAG TPA: lysylphosphatidylglycerol synthase transmembrane domain-containing protein [archaeon]|nr:lysylphosphatidylglycerol synthase transmembrane domain-containing protein [archaeon]